MQFLDPDNLPAEVAAADDHAAQLWHRYETAKWDPDHGYSVGMLVNHDEDPDWEMSTVTSQRDRDRAEQHAAELWQFLHGNRDLLERHPRWSNFYQAEADPETARTLAEIARSTDIAERLSARNLRVIEGIAAATDDAVIKSYENEFGHEL
jgi:hypothetical protein